MRLEEYIEKTGIPVTRLAKRCGVSFHQIYNVLRGTCPTLKSACLINHYTEGQVSFEELMPPEMIKEVRQKCEKHKESH